jgi:GMP synthase-like glutamine amidotransferase
MSWECPHQTEAAGHAYCERLSRSCAPLASGCVLHGAASLLGADQKENPMRAHVFQHVPFEGLGSIEPWLRARRAAVSFTRFYESAALPALGDIDLLIALGGPMSVNDEDVLPWLRSEKQFVASAIAAGKPVLGICLGAQLIASALGARVYPGPQKEIGWFPVFAAEAGARAFGLPAEFLAFHWHGETFDLPPGATPLCRSAACANQAFSVGPRALALQFHLETTPASADAIISNCRAELKPRGCVQSEEALRQATPHAYAAINELMRGVLDRLTL